MTLAALKPQAPAQVIWQDATPECQVGDVIRKPYAPIALVVGKETLKNGRTCLIVTFPNCRDRHTEEWVVGEVAAPVVEESVEVEAPAASAPAYTAEMLKTLTWNQIQKLHTSLGLKATAKSRTRRDYEVRILAQSSLTATTDDAPPNRGDNGRGRVTALTALPEATIILPHAIKPKADDNFMTAFTKESEGDRKFNDLTYLTQLEMEAQLAVERTVIGSEEEATAYTHLWQIERDIEFYNRPESKPQPSPVIQQLETQMKELKKDVLSLFKITPFDSSILSTHDEHLDEQPPTEEAEGTIHWRTPLEGTIVGKKGATRPFYIRNDEIFIIINAGFTASETKHPNVRHQQIRAAIEAGRSFDPKMYKQYACFARETENYNGKGRIKQGQDGRWWAWSIWSKTGTGHPFFSREIAIGYLDKMAQHHQLARQSATCAK
ncbi:hypothetical protein [Microcoleus sp. B3-D7]|uniref:hypothetical protein n=1 Tax=Microcoleus sp. B3-D7 TaxID=2818659 RepID=UPI002FD381E5